MAGFIAWLMWLVVHVMYLVGFKNRFTTMVHWAVSFLFRGRSQRTTTRQQIVARTLMARLTAAEQALAEAMRPPRRPNSSCPCRAVPPMVTAPPWFRRWTSRRSRSRSAPRPVVSIEPAPSVPPQKA